MVKNVEPFISWLILVVLVAYNGGMELTVLHVWLSKYDCDNILFKGNATSKRSHVDFIEAFSYFQDILVTKLAMPSK